MAVPKAAVNEDNFAMFFEHKIRLSRQTPDVESIPVTEREDKATDEQFRS